MDSQGYLAGCEPWRWPWRLKPASGYRTGEEQQRGWNPALGIPSHGPALLGGGTELSVRVSLHMPARVGMCTCVCTRSKLYMSMQCAPVSIPVHMCTMHMCLPACTYKYVVHVCIHVCTSKHVCVRIYTGCKDLPVRRRSQGQMASRRFFLTNCHLKSHFCQDNLFSRRKCLVRNHPCCLWEAFSSSPSLAPQVETAVKHVGRLARNPGSPKIPLHIPACVSCFVGV